MNEQNKFTKELLSWHFFRPSNNQSKFESNQSDWGQQYYGCYLTLILVPWCQDKVKFIYSEKAWKCCEIFTLHLPKVRWRFRKLLWPSQNTWTLADLRNLRNVVTYYIGQIYDGDFAKMLAFSEYTYEFYLVRYKWKVNNISIRHNNNICRNKLLDGSDEIVKCDIRFPNLQKRIF